EFWPAFKSVAPRDHKLRMVQRECCRIRARIAPIHFGDGGWITGAEIAQQFLRLTFQLLEIRMLAHPPGRQVRFHMSSFPLRPVSACSGRKEFISRKYRKGYSSGGRSPFRGHGGALKAPWP